AGLGGPLGAGPIASPGGSPGAGPIASPGGSPGAGPIASPGGSLGAGPITGPGASGQSSGGSPPIYGTIVAVRDNSIIVACGDGLLAVTEVQRPGRRPVAARDLINTVDLVGRRLG